MTRHTRAFAIGALALVSLAQAPQPVSEPLDWEVGGTHIAGTLNLPEGPGPFPAVVIVQGSGRLGRRDLVARAHAQRLPAEGYAVLTFDKRGVGESGGHFLEQSFADLADDVAAGIAALRADPRIDGERIGVLGHSQGGWIGPLVAQRTPIAFLALLSSTPLTPLEQSMFIIELELDRRGMPAQLRPPALALTRAMYELYATGENEDSVRAAVEAARGEPWFDADFFTIQPDTAQNRRWLQRLPFDFDVRPAFAALRVPVLTINGDADALVPGARSRDLFDTLETGADVTAVLLPGLDHRLGTSRDAPLDAAYWTALLEWLHGLESGARMD